MWSFCRGDNTSKQANWYTATTILQAYKVIMANANSKQLSIYTSSRCGTTLAFIRNHISSYLMNHVPWRIVLPSVNASKRYFEVHWNPKLLMRWFNTHSSKILKGCKCTHVFNRHTQSLSPLNSNYISKWPVEIASTGSGLHVNNWSV